MRLIATPDSVTVTESGDLTRLDLVTAAPDRLDALLRATGLGRIDDTEPGHALLTLEPLRRAARPAGPPPDWDRRWDAMIRYAAERGWVSADGASVRVHLILDRSTS